MGGEVEINGRRRKKEVNKGGEGRKGRWADRKERKTLMVIMTASMTI
jgi:hypothetical protein